MSTQLMTRATVAAKPQSRRGRASRASHVSFRAGTSGDARALHALIAAHLAEGHLLPRELDELTAHTARFVVAVRRGAIVGCAELAPLSARVAEIRSLVVTRDARGLGIGSSLINALQQRARRDGFETLCAFTHDARYFVQRRFSIVPHIWVPEKIALDCHRCPLFRRCGQHAVVLSLAQAKRSPGHRGASLAALRG
jgi:amino-acid N-acetyltransferase